MTSHLLPKAAAPPACCCTPSPGENLGTDISYPDLWNCRFCPAREAPSSRESMSSAQAHPKDSSNHEKCSARTGLGGAAHGVLQDGIPGFLLSHSKPGHIPASLSSCASHAKFILLPKRAQRTQNKGLLAEPTERQGSAVNETSPLCLYIPPGYKATTFFSWLSNLSQLPQRRVY